jgi:hypothetical protein
MALKYLCAISGLRGKVDENCVSLGYYVAGSGNFLSTSQDNPWIPSTGVKDREKMFLSFSFEFFTTEDGTR